MILVCPKFLLSRKFTIFMRCLSKYTVFNIALHNNLIKHSITFQTTPNAQGKHLKIVKILLY